MKKFFKYLIFALLIGTFLYTLYFLYAKDQEKPVVYDTDVPAMGDIYKKTVATGSIVPREEVELKPRVSGVISEIYVEAGQMVKKGDKVARIKIIPNVVSLNNAENRLKTAELNVKNQQRELERQKLLLDKEVVAERDYQMIELNFKLAQEELAAAQKNLELVREGALKGAGNSNNLVTSTVSGMVLDVPVKEGASVIESNNFNDGTTIVSVANMNDMIFEGNADESEVGKLKEGMILNITVGAIENEVFKGNLEYISPKGAEDQGTIQFEIKASLSLKDDVFVRAGYSANAEIVLDKRINVLTIKESLISYEEGKPYVFVEVGNQEFEKRAISLGLSDGLNVEVLSGISIDDKLKVIEEYGKKFR